MCKEVFFRKIILAAFSLFVFSAGLFSDELFRFDKTDQGFICNLSSCIKETMSRLISNDSGTDDSAAQTALCDPLIITKRCSEGKYMYYFFLKEIGTTCAAVAFFPSGMNDCWLKVAQDFTSKELLSLDHINLRGADSAEPSLLYVWQ